MEISADTNLDTIDWPLLESPDSNEMQVYNAAVRISLNEVIDKIKSDVDADTQGKKREKPVIRDQVYDLRKQSRADALTTMAERFNIQTKDVLESSGIGKEILIPGEEALGEILQYLGTSDKAAVMRQIAEFNEKGLGKFGGKRVVDREGKPLYTLSDRKIRILVREVGTENSTRQFELVDAGYRKDIYRRAGINTKST